MKTLPYTDGEFGTEEGWFRVHANNEQTHVVIQETPEEHYIAFAYDIDPIDHQGLAGEVIAYQYSRSAAREQAERWMREHPKGIQGDGASGSRLQGVVSRVLAWAEQRAERIDEQQSDAEERQGGPY